MLQETKLRATQYLPDIIQLQQFFAKLYNVNVDDERVTKMTVMDLQQGILRIPVYFCNKRDSFRVKQYYCNND